MSTIEGFIQKLDDILAKVGTAPLVETPSKPDGIQLLPDVESQTITLPDQEAYEREYLQQHSSVINQALSLIADAMPATADAFAEFCLRHAERIGILGDSVPDLGRQFSKRPFWELLEGHGLLRTAIGKHIHNKMDIVPALTFSHWEWAGSFPREKQVHNAAYAIQLHGDNDIVKRIEEMMRTNVLAVLGYSVQYRLAFYHSVVERLHHNFRRPSTTIFLSRLYSTHVTTLDKKVVTEWVGILEEQNRLS